MPAHARAPSPVPVPGSGLGLGSGSGFLPGLVLFESGLTGMLRPNRCNCWIIADQNAPPGAL